MILTTTTKIVDLKYLTEGKTYIHYNSHVIMPNGDHKYSVSEYFILADGTKKLHLTREVLRLREDVINTTAYIEANFASQLDGLDGNERDFKIIQIGFLLSVTTDLIEDLGVTVYGYQPNEWELSVLW